MCHRMAAQGHRHAQAVIVPGLAVGSLPDAELGAAEITSTPQYERDRGGSRSRRDTKILRCVSGAANSRGYGALHI